MKESRRAEILHILKEKHMITVNELAEKMNASTATIRRDLVEMEEEKLIERFHGGVTLPENQYFENPMKLKLYINPDEKNDIGRYAAHLIKDGQLVFIDAGSSTYKMIDYIRAKDINVVTNSLKHAEKLAEKGIKVFVLGGFIKTSTTAIVGKETERSLNERMFDIAFVGTNGIHEKSGFTTTSEDEGEIKRIALKNSNEKYILADHTKFNKFYFVQFGKLNDATVITDVKNEDFDYSLIKYVATNR